MKDFDIWTQRDRVYDLRMNGTREDIPELVDLENKLRETNK